MPELRMERAAQRCLLVKEGDPRLQVLSAQTQGIRALELEDAPPLLQDFALLDRILGSQRHGDREVVDAAAERLQLLEAGLAAHIPGHVLAQELLRHLGVPQGLLELLVADPELVEHGVRGARGPLEGRPQRARVDPHRLPDPEELLLADVGDLVQLGLLPEGRLHGPARGLDGVGVLGQELAADLGVGVLLLLLHVVGPLQHGQVFGPEEAGAPVCAEEVDGALVGADHLLQRQVALAERQVRGPEVQAGHLLQAALVDREGPLLRVLRLAPLRVGRPDARGGGELLHGPLEDGLRLALLHGLPQPPVPGPDVVGVCLDGRLIRQDPRRGCGLRGGLGRHRQQ